MSYQQQKFIEIADSIREKTASEDLIKPTDFADKIRDVYEAGKNAGMQAEYDTFWDNVQAKGTRSNYQYAFAYTDWSDVPFKPKYEIVATSCTFMFVNSNVAEISAPLTLTGALTRTFTAATMLKTICLLKLTGSCSFSAAFQGCNSLENITVEGEIAQNFDIHWSPLSKESVESIVSALSDTVTGKTVTFNETQIEALNGESSWWTELQETKTNWTFALA